MRARWIIAGLLPLTLTGCAGLATSSAVHAEQPISNAAVPDLDVQALEPVAGQSPREVITGFLLAGESLDGDYGVARKYLTAAASAAWRPTGGATIVTGESDFRFRGSGSQRGVSAVRQATLDPTGHVTESVPAARTTASFGVAKVGSAWRISTVPAGFRPWISDSEFQRVFTARPVYYPAANSRVLVPDMQWYPDAGLATAVSRAVLATPLPWLRPVLRSPSQSGIHLAINAVPVDRNTGVATIDLNPSVLSTDDRTRMALWAAMTATLTTVPGVTRVQLTVAGNRLTAAGLPSAPLVASDLGYQVVLPAGAGPILRKGSVLSWPGSGGLSRRPDGSGDTPVALPSVGPDYYDIASDSSGSTVAALSTDRRSLGLWIGRAPHVVPFFAANLSRPSFTGKVVMVAGIGGAPRPAKASSAGVWAVDTSLSPSKLRARALAVPWLRRSTVLALKVSGEGARVAMIVRAPDGSSTLRVAGLIRDRSGAPTGLATPVTMPVGVTSLADVAWLSDSSLAVLGSNKPADGRAARASQVVQVPLGGESELVTAPGGVQEVVAPGTGPGDVFVVDPRGGVWSREGANWLRQSGIGDVAAPGA